jgi:hypothetical protein
MEVECSISNADFIEYGPNFQTNVDVLNAPGYIQRFVEFLQHEVTELLPLVLLRLIASRHPDIAFCKLT